MNQIYIGSTCKPRLSQRLTKHRGNYKQWKKGNYSHVRSFDLFDKYGVDNCNILLLESYPCLNIDELRKKECYYIKNIPCVNKNIPGRTVKESKKQYYENNIEHIKEYYINNIDHIKEYKGTKCKCICSSSYSRCNKSTHLKSLKHINYMITHDEIIEKVNDLIISINNEQFNIITI